MADDTINEGSEEEKKSSDEGMGDDDFGLPDLEFDELEELDMSGDDEEGSEDTGNASEAAADADAFDMSMLEDSSDPEDGLQVGDLDPPEATALNEGIDEVEDVLDSAQLISDRLGDDEVGADSPSGDIDYNDLMGGDSGSTSDSPFSDSSGEDKASDLFADIDSPDDLAALGMADDKDDAGEPESFDSGGSLFSADGDSGDESDSIFGSGSLSMEPEEQTNFEAADEGSLPPNYKAYTYEETSGGFTKIVVIGIVVIGIIAAGLLYFNNQDEGEKVVAKKERKIVPKKKAPAEAKSTENAVDSENKAIKPVVAKPKATKPKPEPVASAATPGEIERINERTTKSYVIIASFIDEDLAMDYANELSENGKGVKIIGPYGKSKRYRVSIADYPTYGDAASQLEGFKSEFGDQVWALKY